MARRGGIAARLLQEVEHRAGVTVRSVDHVELTEARARAYGETRRELDLLGWSVLDYVNGNPQELTADARKKWVQQARMVWRQDPQAGAAVDLLNDFVFGRGVPKPRAKDEEVQEVIDEFWDDPDNRLVLTSFEAQMALGTDLTLQCNLFLLVFEGDDGKVKLGLLNHDEVQTVVRDPDNRLRALYYLAAHSERRWDYVNDTPVVNPTAMPQKRYYEHWRNVDDAKEAGGDIDGMTPPEDKMGEGRVYHVALNRTSEEIFGNPSMRRLIRWFCHDDVTETLTADGWMKLPEIERRLQAGTMPLVAAMDKESGVLRFEAPEKLTVYPCKDDELTRYQGYGVDMLVTPNHGMLAKDARVDPWVILAAEDAGELRPYVPTSAQWENAARVDRFTLPSTLKRAATKGTPNAWRTHRAAETHAAIRAEAAKGMSRAEIAEAVGCSASLVGLVVRDKIADVPRRPKGEWEALSFSMDKWLHYLGWYVAEGYGNGYVCQSASSPRLPEMRKAVLELGVPVKEEHNGNGQIVLKPAERPKQFGAWLKEHVGEGALNKRLPEFVFGLPPSQLKHLLAGLMDGDGTPTNWRDRDAGRYYTSSQGLADDVQRLLTLMGYRTRLSYIERDMGYTVSFARRDAMRLPVASAERYTGDVYCFSMPSGTTVTRRNGVVGISGNSAYNDFLSARVDMMQASAAFIMKRKVKGTPNQVAKMAARAVSRTSELAGVTGTGDSPPQSPPAPGSILTENENVSHEALNLNTNSAGAAQDAQMIRASISAATRFPQSYLGDPSNSNLATATCHDSQTETLTSAGWLTLDQMKGRVVKVAAYDPERDEIRYEVPRRMIVQPYSGPMMRFTGDKRADMLVTPNHRMLVRRGDSLPTAKPFEYIEAGSLKPGCRYYSKAAAPVAGGVRARTFTLPGVSIYTGNGRGGGVKVLREDPAIEVDMDAFLDWLGWFIAEGSGGGEVTQSVDSRWLDEIQQACRGMGVASIEKVKTIGGRDHWTWKPRNPKAWRTWLEPQCGSGAATKRVPPFVFALTADQQMRVLRGAMRGDGGCGADKNGWEVRGTSYYSTTSEQLADDIQRLACNCGFRAVRRDGESYETVRGARTAYTVVLTAPAKSPSRGTHGAWVTMPKPTVEHYEGEVYCFETSTGAFVTRRNGRVAIQGNSLELPVLKAVESRQEVFESIFRWALDLAIEKAVDSGRLSKTVAADQAQQDPTDLGGDPNDTGSYGPPPLDPSAAPDAEQIFQSRVGVDRRGARELSEYDGEGDDEQETERDLSYELSMPNPLKRMLTDLTTAISSIASTFDPNGSNIELSRVLLTIALGEGLEVQDPAALVKQIFPEGYEDPAIAAAQAQAQAAQFQPSQPPPDSGQPGVGAGGQQPGRAAPGTSAEYQNSQGQMQQARFDDLPDSARSAREQHIDITERIFDEELGVTASRLGRHLTVNGSSNGKG